MHTEGIRNPTVRQNSISWTAKGSATAFVNTEVETLRPRRLPEGSDHLHRQLVNERFTCCQSPRLNVEKSQRGCLLVSNTSHAARCVVRQGVRSHADTVALVIECSIPIV